MDEVDEAGSGDEPALDEDGGLDIAAIVIPVAAPAPTIATGVLEEWFANAKVGCERLLEREQALDHDFGRLLLPTITTAIQG